MQGRGEETLRTYGVLGRVLTVKQLLDWFDCVERVNVRNRQAQHCWSTETTKRDRAFLDLFFDQTL